MKKALAISVLLLLLSALIYLRFTDFFQHANSRVIEPWGDGYKAYHAILYHAHYDSTLTHFQGMNYPYGDHVVPGACQPLLSNGMKILARLGWDVRDYGFGIVHFSLLLGLLLCGLFLYLIFARLKLPAWYGIPVAIALAFLSPQIIRMEAHYGLAHTEVLPIVFYLLLRWHQRPHWSWSLALGGIVWAYSLIHFYYFAILGLTIGTWMLTRWIARRDFKQTISYFGHGVLMLGLPLLFFYFWMMHNDPVLDRNPVPYGFFVYRSYPISIYTDLKIPHWQWINAHILKVAERGFESKAYAGMIGVLFLLVTFVKWIVKRKWPWGSAPLTAEKGMKVTQADAHTTGAYLHYLVLTGFIMLLFSFGIPFVIPGGEALLPFAGPLQQFRSIGRFAWVFYYAINIGAFYYLYRWAKATHAPSWRTVLLVGAMLFVAYESYFYNTRKNIALDEIENFAEGSSFLDRGIDYSEFQAVIPVPFPNIGSDNFWWEAPGWMGQKAHTISLQTGLPLTSSLLTRTSLSQTLRQLQFVTEPYRMPSLLNDLPNEKPFLLIWDNVRYQEYGERFAHLNRHGELLYEADYLHLYRLPLDSWAQRLADRRDSIRQSLDSMYLRTDGWRSSDSTAQWLYTSFDQLPQPEAYFGDGEFQGAMDAHHLLLDSLWSSDYTGSVTVAFWVYLNQDRASRTHIEWEEWDARGENRLAHEHRRILDVVDLFDDQGWGMVEFELERRHPNSRIRIRLHNPDVDHGTLRIDELLIRPSQVDIGRFPDQGMWWNNRYYPVR